MSNTAGTSENSTQAAKAASTGRAVLLLALFVALGVLLLNAVDEPNAENTAVLQAAAPVPEQVAAPAVVTPTTVVTRLPSDIRVLVANGVGVNGAASRVASRLQPIGYLLVTPGNTTTPSPTSSVAYAEGYQAEAQQLATSLGLAATAVQPLTPTLVGDLQNANLVVVVGNDLATTAAPANSSTAGNGATGATGATGAATPAQGQATTNSTVQTN